jgi:hypothetical protein
MTHLSEYLVEGILSKKTGMYKKGFLIPGTEYIDWSTVKVGDKLRAKKIVDGELVKRYQKVGGITMIDSMYCDLGEMMTVRKVHPPTDVNEAGFEFYENPYFWPYQLFEWP